MRAFCNTCKDFHMEKTDSCTLYDIDLQMFYSNVIYSNVIGINYVLFYDHIHNVLSL